MFNSRKDFQSSIFIIRGGYIHSVPRILCACMLCVNARARARVLYMGRGVENTGVVRSIRTSHGSIGACTTRARYTLV